MEKISNRALVSRLFTSANQRLEGAEYDMESWTQWYEVVQQLTVPEKMVYVIERLNQAVTNGGFSEFYESSFGIFAPEMVHALNEIKALDSAEILSASMRIINPSGLLDEKYKEFVFELTLSEEQKAQLFSQDVRYDQLQDQENLEDLLGDYLQKMIQ